MSESAHVRSTDAIVRFKANVLNFEEEARRALITLDQQVTRALEVFDTELPRYWQQQIRKQYDEVARTRSALETCQMREVAGDRPSCIEEEKAFRLAKQRLQYALDKPDIVRRWAIQVHQEVDEFRARTGGLRRVIDADLPRLVGLLERTVSILDQYSERAAEGEQQTEPKAEDATPPAKPESTAPPHSDHH